MWGRSPGKHSGGGKERLPRRFFRRVEDAAATQPWGMSGWEGAAVAAVWRVEDGRGSGRAAGGTPETTPRRKAVRPCQEPASSPHLQLREQPPPPAGNERGRGG